MIIFFIFSSVNISFCYVDLVVDLLEYPLHLKINI
mgnify:CR=1 FL=1